MKFLEQFFKPIDIADKPMEEGHRAYKMDAPHGESGMRRFVGLGECNCCDYFLPHENSIVFIEETRLLESMQNFRNEYPYLNDKHKDDIAIKKVRDEMRLKVYGSMLVLCRLKTKFSEAKELFTEKKYDFWLVASNMNLDDIVTFDNLKDHLCDVLQSNLGHEIIESVELLPPDGLKKKLSKA